MKKLLIALALAGTASISTTAGAEPRPAAGPAMAYDWSGLYIGIQGGSGTSHTTVTNVTDTHFFTFIGDSRSITASGFLGGVILGAQKQFGLMILGIEAGSAWGTLSKTVRTQGRFTLDNYNAKIIDPRFVAGKIGVTFDRTLIYGKGGWATAGVSTQSDEFPEFTHFGHSSGRQNGYVVGVGAEYAWMAHVIAGIEYNYYDLGAKAQVGTSNTGGSYTVAVHPTAHAIVARLSYKFN